MVTVTLYPRQLEVLREFARENGLMSDKNKDGVNTSGALQAIIDDWIKMKGVDDGLQRHVDECATFLVSRFR